MHVDIMSYFVDNARDVGVSAVPFPLMHYIEKRELQMLHYRKKNEHQLWSRYLKVVMFFIVN